MANKLTKRAVWGLLLAGLVGVWWWRTGAESPSTQDDKSARTARAIPFPTTVTRPAAVDRSLSGTVYAPTGEPVPDARVCATCASCAASAPSTSQCTVADARGRYRFGRLEPIAYRVVATAPGFTPGIANDGQPIVGAADAEGRGVRADITLGAGGVVVAGTVIDALGGPIGGAQVRAVQRDRGHRVIDVVTRDDGGFSIALSAGSVSLFASAEGYSTTRRVHVAPATDVELRLTPGSVLAGTVVTAADGAPISGAEVRAQLVGRPPQRSRPSVQSAADGSFSLQGLEPGTYVVEASGPMFRGLSEQVALGLADQASGVVVEVDSASDVRGQILVGKTEAPCPQGRVTLSPHVDRWHPRDRRTPSMLSSEIDGEGRVRFEGVPAGGYRVNVRCRDHALREGPQQLSVGAEPIEALRWRVEPGLGLSIAAVDARGEPVPHAQLALIKPGEALGAPRPLRMPVTTDAEGRYETERSLKPGSYRVEPAAGMSGEPVELELQEGSGLTEVVVELAGSAAIEVAVRSTDGDPVDGLRVEARTPDAATARPQAAVPQGRGRYRIGPLSAGRYEVRASDGVNPVATAEEHGDSAFEVREGDVVEVTVTFSRGEEITGRVVDPQGEPVPDVLVHVESGATDPRSRLRTMMMRQEGQARALTDGDGAFTLGGLADGATFTVRAQQPNGGGAVASHVESGSRVELVLEPPGSIHGRVLGPDAEPVSGFVVSAHVPETGERKNGRSADPEGRFVLEGLRPGEVQVTASTRDGLFGHARVALGAGEVVDDLVLTLQPRISPESMAAATGGKERFRAGALPTQKNKEKL